MPASIRDSKILVTGATGGIGHAIARTLHARGGQLTLTGRRLEVLEQLRAELGDRVAIVAADLADRDELAALAERGSYDVLVANAALPASGPWDRFSSEQIDAAIDVNLRAPMQLSRALAPAMVERGSGQIVLVSSLAGKVASPRSAIYSATKFGLRGFGFSMNEDLRGTGVGVSSIYLGFISDAGMFHETGVKLPKGFGTRKPEQVADAIASAIEKGPAEVDVAPLSMRSGAWAFGAVPSLVASLQRKLGGERVGGQIVDKQSSKH
jgi:short-subunit dehydrogenase